MNFLELINQALKISFLVFLAACLASLFTAALVVSGTISWPFFVAPALVSFVTMIFNLFAQDYLDRHAPPLPVIMAPPAVTTDSSVSSSSDEPSSSATESKKNESSHSFDHAEFFIDIPKNNSNSR
jgi:hypothetical protein